MCDYSLHAVATRPAEVAETLVSTNFSTGTHGFASPDDPKVAVCLRPGTEIAFENDVQTDGMMFRKNIGVRLARFRQINLKQPYCQAPADSIVPTRAASVGGLLQSCRLLAPNGPASTRPGGPLSGDERTSPRRGPRSQFDSQSDQRLRPRS